VLDDERAAIRKAALKDAENLARLFDLGTPDGHAIADDIRKLADAERTVAQPVEQTRALIVEECARFVERGSFLHPEAPPAKFAKECAVAMRSQLLTAARPASGETE
jgi:hypothetical protein